ncbi:hypothetical protein MY5147_000693 [Beauveria neobassiana]
MQAKVSKEWPDLMFTEVVRVNRVKNENILSYLA